MLDRLQAKFPEHYRSGDTLLIRADCMDVMAECGQNEFDLCVCDPPYGIGMGGGLVGNSKKDYKQFAGEDSSAPDVGYFQELMKVGADQIIWGANHFIDRMPINASGWIVWDKVQPEEFTMAMCELAWCSCKKPAKIYKQRIVGADGGFRIHPTQKPVKLYQWLLDNYAEKGQRILDTHLGSGSSAIAAHYFGCTFVGVELDSDYFNAAVKRFEQMTRQEALF